MSKTINKLFAASLATVVLAGAAAAVLATPANAQDAGKAVKLVRQGNIQSNTVKMVRPSNIEGLRLSGPAVGKIYSPGATALRSAVIAEHPMGMARMGGRR